VYKVTIFLKQVETKKESESHYFQSGHPMEPAPRHFTFPGLVRRPIVPFSQAKSNNEHKHSAWASSDTVELLYPPTEKCVHMSSRKETHPTHCKTLLPEEVIPCHSVSVNVRWTVASGDITVITWNEHETRKDGEIDTMLSYDMSHDAWADMTQPFRREHSYHCGDEFYLPAHSLRAMKAGVYTGCTINGEDPEHSDDSCGDSPMAVLYVQPELREYAI
jgi:hypothetical protein